MIQGIKDILVGVTRADENSGSASALDYALSLAGQASACLSVQAASVRVQLRSAWTTGFATNLVGEENRRRQRLAEAVAAEANNRAKAAGLTCTTDTPHLPYPDLLDSFAFKARLHDLTVYAAEPESLGLGRGVIETLLTQSGRPLIVVPSQKKTFSCRRIVIAWDGSDRAARAANDALPLLHAAEAVEIVSVLGEKHISDDGMGTKFVPHLARHGIQASVASPSVQDGDVAATLRTAAAKFGADLIVMGGYFHSRTRELIFGGVTQSLLKNSEQPLFMSY